MRPPHRRENLGKGARGKHHEEFKTDGNRILLMPELSKIFPAHEAVNSGLNSLMGVARSVKGLTSRKRTRQKAAPRLAR